LLGLDFNPDLSDLHLLNNWGCMAPLANPF
jgi:hypothetical protein